MSNDVNVKVGADNSALDTGLAAAKHAVDSFKEHAQESFKEAGKELLGAFAVTAVVEGIHALIEEFAQVAETAARLNTTAEAIQQIAYAAKLSGTSLESVTKGLEKVNFNAIEALKGNEQLSSSFKKLNIDVDDFVNLSPQEQILEIAKANEKAKLSANELGHAFKDVLGKGAYELVPLLKEGEEGIKGMFASATVASNETVAKLKEDQDKLEALWMNFKAVGVTAVSAVTDAVKYLFMSLNAFGTYLAHLPEGFKEANRAANTFVREYGEQQEKEKAERDKRLHNGQKTDVEGLKEEAKQAAELKEQEEIAKLKDENAKKEEAAHFRNLELLEKQKELQEKIGSLSFDKNFASPLDEQRIKGQILDYQKELEVVNNEISQEQEKDDKERAEAAKKAAEELAKDNLKAKKEELKDAESSLKELQRQKTANISIDSLRSIGGGIKGVNYNPASAHDELQKQQVDYARQTVDKLTQAVELLQEQADGNAIPSYDSSFN